MIPVTSTAMQDIVDNADERELWITGRLFEHAPYFHAGKGGDTRLTEALRMCLDGKITPQSDGSYQVQGSGSRVYRVAESCSCPASQHAKSRWCKHAVGVAVYVEWQRRIHPQAPVALGTLRAGTLPLPPVSVEERMAQAAPEADLPLIAHRDESPVYETSEGQRYTMPEGESMADEYIPEPEMDDAPMAILEPSETTAATPQPLPGPVLLPSLDARTLEQSMQAYAAQRQVVTRYIKEQMTEGVDYYTLTIKGRVSKATLSKAGSEKFLSLFQLTAQFQQDEATWRMLGSKDGLLCYTCADEETDILTTHGWQPHTALQIGDIVAQVDPYNERMFWGPTRDIHRYAVSNELLVSIRSGRLHMLLTKNHQCLVYRKRQTKLEFIPAEDVKTCYHAPILRPWADEQTPDTGPSLAMAELLGWYITDGSRLRRQGRLTKHLYRPSTIHISQSLSANPEKCTRIRTLLVQVGARFHEYIGRSRGEKITFTVSGAIAEQMIAYTPDKYIPLAALLWPQATIAALLAGLIGGDGSRGKNGRQTFIQTHKPSCDMVQALFARLGIPSVIIPVAHKRLGQKPAWHVYTQERVNRFTQRIEEWPYTGIVWCPETESHTWLARRNGHVFLTGNCHLLTRSGEVIGEGRGARSVSQDGGDINKAIKMATKSAQVDAVLRTGALSDVFTQDLDDAPPEPVKPNPLHPAAELRQRIWAKCQELAPDARTREAVEAFIKERTGMDLHPDFYQAVLARLEGRA